MTEPINMLQPLTEPGIASAEEGLVILDGPDGVAVTMTPGAAAQTGLSLITAAEIAERQISEAIARDNI
ncbi:MAG TPA: hypothetical protein VF463_18085 [Sphingobium sp.]